MKYSDFPFLFCFWLGIMLLTVKNGAGLKARAVMYIEKYAPKEKKGGLIRVFVRAKKAMQQEKLEKELTESLAYIKNLVVLGRGKSLSSELLLTELADVSRTLAPVYLDMAHWLHTNEKDMAARAFASRFERSFAGEIGQFLAGWEDIDPSELLPSVELYQSALREDRLTRQLQKDEAVSDLAYFPVVINCMAVLLNFIYVAYFISQREALGMLMG